MELKDYIEIILRRKYVILITLLIAMIVTAIGTFLMTPTYSATAKMRISSVTSGGGTRIDLTYTDRLMNTYIDIATSDLIISQVVERHGEFDSDSITVDVLANTELMLVTAVDEDPIRATDIANSVTEFLMVEGRNARVATVARTDAISIISPATVPLNSSSPNMPLNMALSAILGIIGGLGLAFVAENLDSRLYTKEQIASTLDAPALGRIPSAEQKGQASGPFINMPMREAYRRLGANIMTLSRNENMQAFIVTSAFPNEGKSTITANLASTLSRIGLKVIVVDCDLYKPSIHRIFNVSNHIGLTSVLNGQVPLSQSIYVKRPDNVHVLASGPVGRREQSPTPYPYGIVHRQDAIQLEQLGSAAMFNLMTELRGRYDIILIDTPPSLEITDSSVLVPMIDGVLVVVDRTQAHLVALEEVRQQFHNVSATIAGVVVNRDSIDGRLSKELEQRRKPYYLAAKNDSSNAPIPMNANPTTVRSGEHHSTVEFQQLSQNDRTKVVMTPSLNPTAPYQNGNGTVHQGN